MSDIIIYIFIALLSMFFGFMSVLFLRDVFMTLKAKLKNDRNTTMLTRREMFYHVFIGVLTGVFTVLLLLGFILLIDTRSNHP